MSHQPGFVGLPLLTLGVVVLLVAVLHPLQVTPQHVVLSARTAAVLLPPQHLAHQGVLDLGQLVQDEEGLSGGEEEEEVEAASAEGSVFN